MKVIWTRHAIERQQEWERKLGITRQVIEQLVVNPAQIVQGISESWLPKLYGDKGYCERPSYKLAQIAEL